MSKLNTILNQKRGVKVITKKVPFGRVLNKNFILDGIKHTYHVTRGYSRYTTN